MRTLIYLIIGFISGLFTSGVHRWLVSEYQTSSLLPGYVSYVSLALIAMGIAVAYPMKTIRLGIAVGMGLPIIATYVAFKDMSRDPTSHNLFPIEIVLTFFLGTVPSLIGSVAGQRIALFLGNRPDVWKRWTSALIWAAGITGSVGLLIAVKIDPAYINAWSAYRSVHFGITADKRLTYAGDFDKLAHEEMGYEATAVNQVNQGQTILDLKTGRESWTITDPFTKRESIESGVKQFSPPGMNCFGINAKPADETTERSHMLCIITDNNRIKAQNTLKEPYDFSAQKGELYYRIDLSPSALPLFYTLQNTCWDSNKASIFNDLGLSSDNRLTYAGDFDKLAHEELCYKATAVNQWQTILELKTGREFWTITDPFTKRKSTEAGVKQFSPPGMNCFGVNAKPADETTERSHMFCIITDNNRIKAQNTLKEPYDFSAQKGELYYRIDLSPSALPLFYTLENTWWNDKVSIFISHDP